MNTMQARSLRWASAYTSQHPEEWPAQPQGSGKQHASERRFGDTSLAVHPLDALALPVLQAWSRHPQILDFDQTLVAQLKERPPCRLLQPSGLLRTGSNAAYLELRGEQFMDQRLVGAFVMSCREPHASAARLDVLLDIGDRLVPMSLAAPPGNLLNDALRAAVVDFLNRSPELCTHLMPEDLWALGEDIMLALESVALRVMYLGEADADLVRNDAPASDGLAAWKIGFAVGEALRRGYHERETQSGALSWLDDTLPPGGSP